MGNAAGLESLNSIGWHACGTVGAVAAGGAASVQAGLSLLEHGGNAADAAVATLLALSITDYGLFAMGGECPLLWYGADTGQVEALAGLGGAPQNAKAWEWIREHGIPAGGGIQATPVPGAPDLCLTALARYGTRRLKDVAGPCLDLLAQGNEEWHGALRNTMLKLVDAEKQRQGSRIDGILAARDRFYRGDIADHLVAYYQREGGLLDKEDLARHVTRVEAPVAVPYRGHTVYKCQPWTQGPHLCQALRMLEGYDLQGMGRVTPAYIHTVVEALKLSFADRDAYYADPLVVDVPMDALLSMDYAALRRALIDPERASHEIRPGNPRHMKPLLDGPPPAPEAWIGGTTTCVVADRQGNVVAATPSANPPYSVCPELGIAHGNRLRCLNAMPGHPNVIEPGKRPRITLTPTLIGRDERVIGAISVAGGDLQDQTTLTCLLNWLEFGMPPEQAVTAPRFSTGHHENSFSPEADRQSAIVGRNVLSVDPVLQGPVTTALTAKGHNVILADKPIGNPVMLCLDPETGLIQAAGDPKAGRHAGAL